MQIELFREFLVLSVTKNFSEAAQQLHMSQPSLSRHMDLLEKNLKCKLLFRTKPISLTPRGVRILEYANNVVRAYDEMIEYANAARKASCDIIKINDISYSPLPHNFLSKREAEFTSLHSEITFCHVEPAPGKCYWDLLEKGEIDIGFAYGFGTAEEITVSKANDALELVLIPAYRGNLCFLISKDNPILAKEEILLSDCKNLRFLSQAQRHLDPFRASFTEFC